jgi:hypothetical protein
VIAGMLILFNLSVFLLLQRTMPEFDGDFKMFYTAAVALRSGHADELYSRDIYVKMQRRLIPTLPLASVKVYTHPPYELLVFLPFSLLSYQAACCCWLALTLLLAAVCGRLMGSYGAILGMFPFLVVLVEQQDSILALGALVGCWLALQRDRDVLAGLILGLALFKFQIVIPLALVLAFWRPKLLRGLAMSAAAVLVLSLILAKPQGMVSYWRYVEGMARDSSTAVSPQYLMDPRTNATLRGLVYEVASNGAESMPASAARLSLIILGVLGILTVLVALRFMRSESHAELKFSFAVMTAVLLSFHLLPHDLILLSVPFILLAGSTARWPLAGFYVAPVIYLLYPHSQAWLALLPALSLLVMSRGLDVTGRLAAATPEMPAEYRL